MGGTVRITQILAVGALLATSITFSCADEAIAPGSTSTSSATTGPAVTVPLPAPLGQGPVSLEEAIGQRRSVREYGPAPLTTDELGQILWAAQGITSPTGGRAVPSAGGTYPLELYVVAGLVTSLEPGVYRYQPEGHTLVAVAFGDLRASLAKASLGQQWVANAPVDVVIATAYERTTEKYGERGNRYVHLEAGHAAQNLCLQATALGLGAVTVGAFSDDEVAALLGLAQDEVPLYVIPVGHRP